MCCKRGLQGAEARPACDFQGLPAQETSHFIGRYAQDMLLTSRFRISTSSTNFRATGLFVARVNSKPQLQFKLSQVVIHRAPSDEMLGIGLPHGMFHKVSGLTFTHIWKACTAQQAQIHTTLQIHSATKQSKRPTPNHTCSTRNGIDNKLIHTFTCSPTSNHRLWHEPHQMPWWHHLDTSTTARSHYRAIHAEAMPHTSSKLPWARALFQPEPPGNCAGDPACAHAVSQLQCRHRAKGDAQHHRPSHLISSPGVQHHHTKHEGDQASHLCWPSRRETRSKRTHPRLSR